MQKLRLCPLMLAMKTASSLYQMEQLILMAKTEEVRQKAFCSECFIAEECLQSLNSWEHILNDNANAKVE